MVETVSLCPDGPACFWPAAQTPCLMSCAQERPATLSLKSYRLFFLVYHSLGTLVYEPQPHILFMKSQNFPQIIFLGLKCLNCQQLGSELHINVLSSGFTFFFFLGRATPAAYGSSQARGWIRDAAAGLCPSHINMGFKLHLGPTPQLTIMLDLYLTHWVRPGIEPASSCILVGFVTHWATTELLDSPLRQARKDGILPPYVLWVTKAYHVIPQNWDLDSREGSSGSRPTYTSRGSWGLTLSAPICKAGGWTPGTTWLSHSNFIFLVR